MNILFAVNNSGLHTCVLRNARLCMPTLKNRPYKSALKQHAREFIKNNWIET